MPGPIVFEAVYVNEQWGSSAACDFDARGEGHPVVRMDEVVLPILNAARGRHGVTRNLGKQVLAIVRAARSLLGVREVRAGNVSMLEPGDLARRTRQRMQDLGRQDLGDGRFVKRACRDELPIGLLVQVRLQHRRHADHLNAWVAQRRRFGMGGLGRGGEDRVGGERGLRSDQSTEQIVWSDGSRG